MTVTLRSQSNARATTKGSTLTHTELDNNFIHFLDTGIDIVGDDSTGTTFKPGDDLKVVGAGSVTTAVSGQQLTVTGTFTASSTDTLTNKSGNISQWTNDSGYITGSSSNTLTNKTIDANGTGNSISNLEVADFAASAVVIESEGIASNDNDTTLPTSAAVKDYADTQVATKTTLTGSTNNTITTVTGANAIQGESNLTFDGNTLSVNGNGEINALGAVTAQSFSATTSISNDAISINDNIIKTIRSNENLELDANGTGDIVMKPGNITATLSGTTNGDFTVESAGTGGLVFANNESETAYPTGALVLKNTQNDAEINFGQYLTADIQYYSVYFDPNNNKYTRRGSSFAGDQNVFFGFDWTNPKAILQGNGGDEFEIDTFNDNDQGYGNKGPITLKGGYVKVDSNLPYINISGITSSTQPPRPTSSANIYAADDGGTVEMYVQDEASNITKISPHNDSGEWEYFSYNQLSGKVVRVNMEKMIKRLEQITGESFFEEFTPGNSH